MWLEFSRCSRCAAVGRLFRSDSSPVSRGGRPNISRKELVMLPSGSAIERWSSGNEGERLRNGAGILLGRAGDLADGVDQHLRIETAQRIEGEIGRGLGAAGCREWKRADRSASSGSGGRCASGRNAEAISSRSRYASSSGLLGGLSGPDVVRLVDDAASQQPGPDAVHDVAGEPRVIRGDQPVGEDLARILVRGDAGRRAVGKNGRRRRPAGSRFVLAGVEEDDLFLPFARGLVADLGEEGRHGGQPLLGPVLGPSSHEGQRHGLCDGLRLLALDGAVEVDLRARGSCCRWQ